MNEIAPLPTELLEFSNKFKIPSFRLICEDTELFSANFSEPPNGVGPPSFESRQEETGFLPPDVPEISSELKLPSLELNWEGSDPLPMDLFDHSKMTKSLSIKLGPTPTVSLLPLEKDPNQNVVPKNSNDARFAGLLLSSERSSMVTPEPHRLFDPITENDGFPQMPIVSPDGNSPTQPTSFTSREDRYEWQQHYSTQLKPLLGSWRSYPLSSEPAKVSEVAEPPHIRLKVGKWRISESGRLMPVHPTLTEKCDVSCD